MTIDERFDSKWIERDCGFETPCHIWTAGVMSGGYGSFWDGNTRRAHAFAYERVNGPLPEGREIHHKCERKLCVNAGHLESLTQPEHAAQHSAAKTHCIRGHPYTNVYVRPDGYRGCRRCRSEAVRRHRETSR